MTDDGIRKLVRAKLANGTLREPQVIADLGRDLVAGGVSVPDPCAVCGGKPSEVLYDPDGPRPGPAFHERCFQIWHEEIAARW
jgi:hypothetical protein